MPATTKSSTLNEAERIKKWQNKRANGIMDIAYSFEDAAKFSGHLEAQLFNVCYDLESVNHSNACLEGTMRTMQKEMAELREFKETTEKALTLNPPLANVFNAAIKEIKRSENSAKKAAKAASKKAPKKKSPKQLHRPYSNCFVARRSCTKDSRYKGFYSGM